jgi:hypothetical protein
MWPAWARWNPDYFTSFTVCYPQPSHRSPADAQIFLDLVIGHPLTRHIQGCLLDFLRDLVFSLWHEEKWETKKDETRNEMKKMISPFFFNPISDNYR